MLKSLVTKRYIPATEKIKDFIANKNYTTGENIFIINK